MSDDEATQGGAPTVRLASGGAEEYLDGVRGALADLPAPEVAEILDDVRAHLADLTAELGADADAAALTDRLGPPRAYASELRAAAGYPAAPEQVQGAHVGLARLAIAAAVAATVVVGAGLLVGEPGVVLFGLLLTAPALPLLLRDGPRLPSVTALPEVRRLSERLAAGAAGRTVLGFLASLQPAWWVARAFAAAVVLVAVLGGGGFAPTLLVGLVGVPVSVWVGHRTRRDRRWLWAVVPLNALAAMVLLVVPVDGGLSGPSVQSSAASYQPGLWQDSEREIQDIRPVDASGTPLTGVYLFDQDGRPIDTSGGRFCAPAGAPVDQDAAEAARPYPRGTWDYDHRTGECVLTPPVPLVVAVPSAGSTAPTAPVAPTTVTVPAPPPAAGASPAPAAPSAPGTPSVPAPPSAALPPAVSVPPAPPVPATPAG
ncbi:HAAS signaling domain-containing protein [Pseudonocardia sichuanensis]